MTASLQKSAEPSMEEILASIRRIIADDQTRAKPATGAGSASDPAKAEGWTSPRETGAGATIEAFPGQGRTPRQPAGRTEDAPHRPAVEADAPADQAEADAGASAAADEPAAANDVRYFPPEAEFDAAALQKDEEPTHDREPRIEPTAFGEPPVSVQADRRGWDEVPEAPASARRVQPGAEPAQGAMLAVGSRPLGYRAAESRVREPVEAQSVARPAAPEEDRSVMLSGEADAAIGRAFDTLRHTVLSDNSRTLEDLVGEMLRPMLKDWLDDNLPPLVERLVRAEIERVARGRPA